MNLYFYTLLFHMITTNTFGYSKTLSKYTISVQALSKTTTWALILPCSFGRVGSRAGDRSGGGACPGIVKSQGLGKPLGSLPKVFIPGAKQLAMFPMGAIPPYPVGGNWFIWGPMWPIIAWVNACCWNCCWFIGCGTDNCTIAGSCENDGKLSMTRISLISEALNRM